MNILIRFSHGLGDVTQFSVVLKHLRKHRPNWCVDVRVGRGKHTALIGLCRRVYHDQEPEPQGPYDQTFDLGWWENYCHYENKPNSKVTNCLSEVFGLDWDAPLGRYTINVSDDARQMASAYLKSIGAVQKDGKFNAVGLHYAGNTSPNRKNIGHWQAQILCEQIIDSGRIPVIFDWDARSPLPNDKTIFCPRPGIKVDGRALWGENWGSGDAEVIAAIISLSEAYIGVDSGPGKVASATETPALILWTGHHPLQFHDPAPNTTHLIPSKHREMRPIAGNHKIFNFFNQNYQFRTYEGEHGIVQEAQTWLGEVLGCKPAARKAGPVQYVLPNGIGDVVWALMKIRSIAGNDPIDIILSGNPSNDVDHRSVPFVKRFSFVNSVKVMDVPVLVDREHPGDDKGRYRYRHGIVGPYHYLVPNATLEAGKRLEEWMPEHPVDWNIMDRFSWENTQRGTDVANALGKFVVFYLGPERGNVDEGHNRGFQWEPKDWIALGGAIRDRGYRIVVVGAHYDLSYWQRYVERGVGEDNQRWINLIGEMEIGETLALLRKAAVIVSYQCGLGIVSHYLGARVVMWWRKDGDSAHPDRMLAFDNEMRYAWTNPAFRDNYIGCLYKQETPADILNEMDKREWLP